MKNLQAHWRPMAVLFVAVVLAGTFLLRFGTERTALALVADPPYVAMTPVERDGVLTLLEEMDLDREALIALNPTAVQAESILATVRTWHENQQATLSTLRDTVATKVSVVRQWEAAIEMGPAQSGQDGALATARQELTDAHAAYASAVQGCQTSVRALLSDSQDASHAAIQDGLGTEEPVAMLSLTDTQRLDLGRAERCYRWQHAAARTTQQRQTAVNARASALGTILTDDQDNVMSAYDGYVEAASANVADAFDLVLVLGNGAGA